MDDDLRVKDTLSRFLIMGHVACGNRLNLGQGFWNDCVQGGLLSLTGEVHGVFRKMCREGHPQQLWQLHPLVLYEHCYGSLSLVRTRA